MNREERIAMIRLVDEIRERCDLVMAVLLPPDADGICRHPPSMIDDESTMGEPLYRCRQCGAESTIPFPTIEG